MRILLLLSSLLLSAAAQSQEWEIDPDASSVRFEFDAFDTRYGGEFSAFSADITLDPDNLDQASIHAVVRTPSGELNDEEHQESFQSRGGLGVETYPEAEFVSDRIEPNKDGYIAVGTLTLKGTSRPATLPFSLSIDGERAVADGILVVTRADFGVGEGWDEIEDKVTVIIHVEADAK